MALLLTNKDVEKALSGVDAAVELTELIERVFVDIGNDDTPRVPTPFPNDNQHPRIFSVSGVVPSLGVLGGAIHVRPRNVKGGDHCSFKLFFDLETLDLVCLMEDGPIHKMVAGAQVGVATRWLAREGSTVLGVLGCGPVSYANVAAACRARGITTARVYSPYEDERRAFATRIGEANAIDARPVATAEEAVRDVDILVCATNNHFLGGTKIFEREWLSPGTHVNSISRGEVDADIALSVRVVPGSVPDLLAITPPWEPYASLITEGKLKIESDLAAIVAGKGRGRTDDEEITLYTGASIGPQHAAIAKWVYDLAKKNGLGQEWAFDGE